MKDPKDMTRDELADKLDALADWLFEEEGRQDENIREAATRLRNSIDRPKVEMCEKTNPLTGKKLWFTEVNGYPVAYERNKPYARYQCRVLRRALGMEGGGL